MPCAADLVAKKGKKEGRRDGERRRGKLKKIQDENRKNDYYR